MITIGIILILIGILIGVIVAYDDTESLMGTAVGGILGALAGGLCSIFFLVNGFSKQQCEKYTKLAGIEGIWSISTNCLVKSNGKILTLSQYVRLQVPNTVYGNAEQNIKVKIEQ